MLFYRLHVMLYLLHVCVSVNIIAGSIFLCVFCMSQRVVSDGRLTAQQKVNNLHRLQQKT